MMLQLKIDPTAREMNDTLFPGPSDTSAGVTVERRWAPECQRFMRCISEGKHTRPRWEIKASKAARPRRATRWPHRHEDTVSNLEDLKAPVVNNSMARERDVINVCTKEQHSRKSFLSHYCCWPLAKANVLFHYCQTLLGCSA